MPEKVCTCINQLRTLVSHTSDAIRFGIRHDFGKATYYVEEAKRMLKELETCTTVPVPFEETRKELDRAMEALEEYKDVVAEERLKLAQWTIFREIRDKICASKGEK
jgi:hypothetical protein